MDDCGWGQGASRLSVDWESATDALVGPGWVRLHRAVPAELVTALAEVEGREWHALHDEGVVHQVGYGAHLPLVAAPLPVAGVGVDIAAAISDIGERRGLAPVPTFNEVTWTRYPQGSGQITAHRDPDAYHGLIAVVTLEGSAPFHVFDEGCRISTTWRTEPGDLVLLRSAWPTSASRCPRHAAEPPADGDRMIMTLRSNSRGAGGGYDVD